MEKWLKPGESLLPQALDAERGILSSVMISQLQGQPDVAMRYLDGRVSHLQFHHPAHATIYSAMQAMWRENDPIDPVTLTAFLRSSGELDSVGGPAFVTELLTFLPTAANLGNYAEIVKEKHDLRQLIAAMSRGIERCHEEQSEIESICDNLELAIARVGTQHDAIASTLECTDSVLERVFAQIRQRESGSEEALGLPTGVPAWDRAQHGIFAGEMIVIGARPAVGKTSMIETAIETQMEIKKHVTVFQKDMSEVTMLGRMAARRARVVYDRFETGLMTSGELRRFRMAVEEIHAMRQHLHLYITPRLTAEKLDAIVRREIREHDIKVWYLDHFFQLDMKQGRAGNITEAATEVSRQLRTTITETGVAGVIVVHLNREADKSARPHAGQFKYCDQLFGDADKVLLLWSKDDPLQLSADQRQEIVLTVDKNRTGPVSDERMHFHRELMTFEAI